ncbi:hypothetical protein IKZ80_04360 [bacterium]|nr:hypothetical protein [bacterium]
MKKNLLYLFLVSLALTTAVAFADEEFDDEDVQFDEEGNAIEEVVEDDSESDDTAPAVQSKAAEAASEALDEEAKKELTENAKEGAGALSQADADKATEGPQFTCPKWSDYLNRLNSKAGSDRGARSYCNKISITDDKGIQRTYTAFRQNDVKMLKLGDSNHASRLKSALKGQKLAVAESTRFVAVYPKTCKAPKGGKTTEIDTAEFYGIDQILSAGDAAFDKATETLVMTDFINWLNKLRGKVYFVTRSEDWTMLKGTGLRNSPVQTVYTAKGYREFYVYLTPINKDWNAEAFAYAVAAAVLDEFLSITNSKGSVNEFLTVGFAAYCSDLTSVITEGGPVQLKTFQNKPVTFDMLQKMKSGALPFKSLPLDKTAIINIDQFVKNGAPTDNYKLYYFLRQSEAIYEYLSIRDALPLVYLMRKSREQNRNFDKDYDNYFASLHRDSFMGKKTEPKKDDKKDKKDKDKKDKKEGDTEEGGDEAEAEDIGSNYKTFRNRIPYLVFNTLTADSVANDIEEQKKAKAQKGKEPGKDQKNQKKSKKD